jgi:phytoene synthase
MDIKDPERALAIAYAPADARAALTLLWRLDERLADVVRATKEARLGQIRLAWWREALERLDAHPAPEEPLLRAIAAELLPRGVTGAALGRVADGWVVLLAPLPLAEAEIAAHAADRGGALFDAAAIILGDTRAEVAVAGEGWALVDLAFHLGDRPTAEAALALARQRIAQTGGWRWPSRLRAVGALHALAKRDAAAGLAVPREIGSPRRVARALLHRVTGR